MIVSASFNNILGESIVRSTPDDRVSFLDGENIVWKVVDGKWIGKRSVWTNDNRGCWLEETNADNIKTWWCGKGADYNEIFTRND